MIQFNELSISSDGHKLIIDIEVKDEVYYQNVYIDSVIIDNQDTFIPEGPSSTPIYEYIIDEEVQTKTLRLVLHKPEVGNLDNMFFIYVRAKGTPAADTPCGMDNITTIGTVCNVFPFYQKAMEYVKEVADTCKVPQHFIDYILKIKALELSIRTGNFVEAIQFFNKYFKGKAAVIGGCSCGK